MDTKETRASKRCQIYTLPLVVLAMAILAVGEVYIAIRVKQLNDRLTRIENRLGALTQNHMEHLERHVQDK